MYEFNYNYFSKYIRNYFKLGIVIILHVFLGAWFDIVRNENISRTDPVFYEHKNKVEIFWSAAPVFFSLVSTVLRNACTGCMVSRGIDRRSYGRARKLPSRFSKMCVRSRKTWCGEKKGGERLFWRACGGYADRCSSQWKVPNVIRLGLRRMHLVTLMRETHILTAI